jgi:hypothetical protein
MFQFYQKKNGGFDPIPNLNYLIELLYEKVAVYQI